MPSPSIPNRTARCFEELYDDLEDDEKDFFDLVEEELKKVEDFYTARGRDATHRAHDLRDQLHELAEHRKIYHELYPNGLPQWEANFGRIIPEQVAQTGIAGIAQKLHLRVPFVHENDAKDARGNGNGQGPIALPTGPADEAKRDRLRNAMREDKDHHTYSPERYQKYKQELKTAVLEFYRQLELVKNYRVFRFLTLYCQPRLMK